MLISRNFQDSTFEIITITVTEIVPIQLFFFTVASKQKFKANIRNTIVPSYIQKSALLKTIEFHFSLVWIMEFSIISLCLGKVKVFLIIIPSNLVDVQRLHEKGKWS